MIDSSSATITPRRSFIGHLLAGALALVAPKLSRTGASMPLTCFIRYELDPFQRDAFAEYADNWSRIIPRCGGDLVGYFLPHEGTNYVGFALISFASLAAYESYRATLKADPEARKNFAFAQARRMILREERSFLEGVASTLNKPSLAAERR